MREIRQNFKAVTGMALADFDAARRLIRMDDPEEAKTKVTNFMTVYNSLQRGEQIDWIDAA